VSYRDHNKCVPSLGDVSLAIDNINLPSATSVSAAAYLSTSKVLLPLTRVAVRGVGRILRAGNTVVNAIARYPPRARLSSPSQGNAHTFIPSEAIPLWRAHPFLATLTL
jgi:hypothetical protein